MKSLVRDQDGSPVVCRHNDGVFNEIGEYIRANHVWLMVCDISEACGIHEMSVVHVIRSFYQAGEAAVAGSDTCNQQPLGDDWEFWMISSAGAQTEHWMLLKHLQNGLAKGESCLS